MNYEKNTIKRAMGWYQLQHIVHIKQENPMTGPAYITE